MKVVISSGHGKYVRGASGYIDEVDEARLVVEQVADGLRDKGVAAITFHDDVSKSQGENLDRIVDFHNAQTRDLDVSVHFNAYETTAKPMGCEVLYVSSTGQGYADKVVDQVCAASGLINRGPKKRTDLAFLNGTEEPAILVETCFVDSQADVEIYHANFDIICNAIAAAIAGEQAQPGPEPSTDDEAIMAIAASSAIASYSWKDRGKAPAGYTKGFALAWAQVVRRFTAGDPVVLEMAKANTHNDSKDALAWYNSNFAALGMSNETAGIDTLRHLFALMMGLGMRESSGKHCCGTDSAAEGGVARPADEIEAGLYQTSYNAHNCCDEFDAVMDAYESGELEGYRDEFAEGVTCSAGDWANHGSGDAKTFQALCKEEPAFAVESCALVLRNLGGEDGHYGPIRRKEAELRQDADAMLLDVQWHVRPEVPPAPDLEDRVAALEVKVAELDTRVAALEQ